MKLDLEDGRMLSLPDEVSDEFARQLKALILTTEGRARDAEARADALAQRVAALEARAPDYAPITNAIGRMHESTNVSYAAMLAALDKLEKTARADRVMVADDFGEFTRSRIG